MREKKDNILLALFLPCIPLLGIAGLLAVLVDVVVAKKKGDDSILGVVRANKESDDEEVG